VGWQDDLPRTMMGPRNECFGCGHAGHDATLSICSVIWMGERCGCGGCAEDEHEWETDYPSRECMKCGLVEDSPEPDYGDPRGEV